MSILYPILIGLMILVSAAMFAVALVTLIWMVDAWVTPDALARTGFAGAGRSTGSFSLIVPARHEERVLGETLDQMAALDHPSFEILAVIGHDDPGTRAIAEAAAARHPDLIQVVIDHSVSKNKPRALNTALPHCSGTYVGVFDAEDEVAPALLRGIEACFRDQSADVVQGGVQLMNFRSSWWALRNVLEYFFYFRSRLHRHARNGFIPLGGNTVFVRRQLLVEAGGWDPDCLTEDCELGVRLSTAGRQVAVAYDPALVTREETPDSIRDLVKQRTRWNQGFLQVLNKGAWRGLPTRRQRLLARTTLTFPFWQAGSIAFLVLALVTSEVVDAPVLVALLLVCPAVVMAVTLSVEMAALREFSVLYGLKARVRDYVRLVVGLVPYQMLLSVAAARAAYRHLRGRNNWEKTTHVGAHRPAVAVVAVEVP